MSGDNGRGVICGRLLEVLVACSARRLPFTRMELAADVEMGPRAVHRYLCVLEGHRIVERIGEHRTGRRNLWRTCYRLEPVDTSGLVYGRRCELAAGMDG